MYESAKNVTNTCMLMLSHTHIFGTDTDASAMHCYDCWNICVHMVVRISVILVHRRNLKNVAQRIFISASLSLYVCISIYLSSSLHISVSLSLSFLLAMSLRVFFFFVFTQILSKRLFIFIFATSRKTPVTSLVFDLSEEVAIFRITEKIMTFFRPYISENVRVQLH